MQRILIVEDDDQLGSLLKSEVGATGYICDWIRRADKVSDALRTNTYDVILLDLMLPDGSGYDLLEEIRSEFQTPIIVVSARILGEDKVRALDLGADDYITKPFWINEVTARIRAILRRHNPEFTISPVVHFGDVTVNFSSREVRRGNKLLALTPTEFGLLDFFAKRPKQAVTREDIIDAVFRNPSSASEALQTHISRLRKKLGPTGRRITTVWGIGYRFDPPEAEAVGQVAGQHA
ncbi:MAG: response regulator transcription factor [Bradymonadia bacterium]